MFTTLNDIYYLPFFLTFFAKLFFRGHYPKAFIAT
jgi:hypothetical protein